MKCNKEKILITCLVVAIMVVSFVVSIKIHKNNIVDVQRSNIMVSTTGIGGTNYFDKQPYINYKKYEEPINVKALYFSEYIMSNKKYRKKWIDLIKEKEINAVVINVKNDGGRVSFDADVKTVKEIGAYNRAFKDLADVVLELKENNIYTIARIVTFKDPYLAEKRPDLAIKDKNGKVLRIRVSKNKTQAWVNPYNRDVWKYNVDLAKEAVKLGFEEIQFDYIRFSSSRDMRRADLGKESLTVDKKAIVAMFTEYAYKELKPMGVYVAADVFATIIHSNIDAKTIGQDYVRMAKTLDYICPMPYPSHYDNGSLGVKYPDLQPYDIMLAEMEKSKEALDTIPEGEHRAIVRPWIQDFTATWVKPHQVYGAKQIREQINAIYDSGLKQWMVWNASNVYSTDGLKNVK